MSLQKLSLSAFFLILACQFACAGPLTLVYPADKTVVKRSDFLILKGGDQPPLEAVTLEINGVTSDPIDISSPEYRAAFADILILEPSWSKGKNSLVVRGIAGGKEAAIARVELFYLPIDDPAAIIPPGYKPFTLHTPEREALCVACHNLQPTSAQLKVALAASNPCASCHARMFNRKFVHGPEGVFQCADCHDGASKPQRWQVTKTELVLCGECHTDKIDEFNKNTFIHGPVATGDCTICHDPHASEQPAQLHSPINALCLGCHENIAKSQHVVRGVSGQGHPIDKIVDPTNKNRKLSCVSCHNPHGAPTKYFFAGGVSNRFELCNRCHQK